MRITLTQIELLDAIKLYLEKQGFDAEDICVDISFLNDKDGLTEVVIDNLQFKSKETKITTVDFKNKNKTKQKGPVVGEDLDNDPIEQRARRNLETGKNLSTPNPIMDKRMRGVSSHSSTEVPQVAETFEELGMDPATFDDELEY